MDFKTHLNKYLTEDEINALINSFAKEEKHALYLNENKLSKESLLNLFPNLRPHPVVENGFLFNKNEYQLGKKVYHELGAYYIQEPSAMLVADILNAEENDLVLDLCAAPGGKTIQTALKMRNKGMIIANDLSKNRANVLLSNIERLGISNTIVTSLDFSTYYHNFIEYFDKIILDAPCSGSGMFRKSDEMKQDWSYEKVIKNAAIQKELILMCYKMLKPGGKMVYSTCSYSFEEDEEVIKYLIENSNAKLINIKDFSGNYRSKVYPETVHLFPNLFEGEGHYIAYIGKPGFLNKSNFDQIEVTRSNSTLSRKTEIQRFLLNKKLPNKFEKFCMRPGLFLDSKIDDRIIPSHQQTHALNLLPSIELTKEELIKYLKGESLNKKYPNGYFAVSYCGMNAGLVHSVNGILKNLYPKGLRISASIDDSF